MSVSNNIISAPVSIADVKSCIGLASNDLGTLCVSTYVKKWAMYKPVSLALVDTLTGQWNASNNSWLTAATWYIGNNGTSDIYRYGMRFPMMASNGTIYNNSGTIVVNTTSTYISRQATAGFFYDLANGNLRWTRQLPSGGANSPYRLQDFAGYCHTAVCPLPFTWTQSHTVTTAGAFNYNLDINTQVLGGLELSDIKPAPAYQNNLASLNDMYVGVLFYNAAKTDFFWKTSEYPISQRATEHKAMRVAIIESEILQKIANTSTWKTRVFLCSKALSWCQQVSSSDSPQAYFVSGDEEETTITLTVEGGVVSAEVSGRRINGMLVAGGTINNGTGNAITFTNIKIETLTAALGGGWDVNQSYTFPDTTISGGGSQNFSNNFGRDLSDKLRITYTYGGSTYSEYGNIS